MTQNTTSTPPAVATAPRFSERNMISLALQDALKAEDMGELQVLVPGLSKNEAHCLIFHTREQARMRMNESVYYGRETWGYKTPPAIVQSATRKVRLVALQAWHPSLSEEDAARIVDRNIAEEIERGFFWRWPVGAPSSRDLDGGRFLEDARKQAKMREVVFHHRDTLAAAHRAALRVLEAAGLPWELLALYARGERGEENAVEVQAQRERERDAQATPDA
jgi:hypothetical protein